jgi:predicted nuclease of restriction endonuclease-like (RecB) superfamily
MKSARVTMTYAQLLKSIVKAHGRTQTQARRKIAGLGVSSLKNCRQFYLVYTQIHQTLVGESLAALEIRQPPVGESAGRKISGISQATRNQGKSSPAVRKSNIPPPLSPDLFLRFSWSQILERIRTDILREKRAEYGEEILPTLSAKLVPGFGQGFSPRNLARIISLAEAFPDSRILATLSKELGWSHFVELLPLKQHLQRDFYAEMCRIERWSVRTLRQKIGGMLFERTALSKKPGKLAELELQQLREKDLLSPDLVFRDPYFLDFLGLKGAFHEKDLEAAILRELESFLTELGSDFAFVARQKRITVDGEDFYLDLLFYHRRLRRLVAIDLKLGRFMPADVGQMEFYLRWLRKHELRPGEEDPIGLVLCAEKSTERVELLELEARGIRVAEYLTELPPREVLQRRLHEAVALARRRLEPAIEDPEKPAQKSAASRKKAQRHPR